MLKPVQVPATADRWPWERLYAYLVAREMETAEQPPHLAAEQALAQVENAWRAKYPGKDLPLAMHPARASTDALPGGIQPGDGLTWAIVSAPTPDGEYLTGKEIAGLVESYDPDFRRAPIVLPSGSGPTHLVGQWMPYVPATVQALAHDGWFLWALIEDRAGSLAFEVDFAGIRDRSIQWWPEHRDLDPPAPYLQHVAFLATELPGVPNMPGLDQYFLGEREPADKGLAVRSLTLKDIPTREVTMADPTKTATVPDGTQTADPPDQGIDMAQLAAALAPELAKALAAAQPKPATQEPLAAPVADPSAAQLTEANEKITALTAEVKTLGDQVTALTASTATAGAEARRQRVGDALDRAVSEGRMTAAHRELEEPVLLGSALTEAQVTERLGKIAALPVTVNPALFAALTYDDADGKPQNVPERLQPPPRYHADPADIARTARALARAGDNPDPDQAYAARRRAIYAEFGHGVN